CTQKHKNPILISHFITHFTFLFSFSSLYSFLFPQLSYSHQKTEEPNMASESETDTNSSSTTTIPTLQLFSLPPPKSPHHSSSPNLITSPLHTSSASVPFSWEEQPGKPLPCLTLALPSNNNNAIKCLDLPPRLLNETKFTKTPSPTTVLEGPYSSSSSSFNVGKSSSFRFRRKRQGSFDGFSLEGSGGNSSSPDRGLLGTIILSRSSSVKRENNKGLFGSWRKIGGIQLNKGNSSKSDVHGGNFVFPSFTDDDGASTTSCDGGGAATVKVSRRNKRANFLGLSPNKSHFWAAIYGAFKQVIPSHKRSTKWKKDAW
ncbi:hypothetical protein RDABS01_009188, partial [Bienertia sinuspersici]